MKTSGKPVLVSGIQPSGRLHIGNYAGALRNFVKLQEEGGFSPLFFIADLHSLTEKFTVEEKREQVRDLMASYIAAGLDPDASTLFIQSEVPSHSELSWILNTIMPLGELERMTQFKDKAARGGASTANVGLLTYPLLMAADILLYDAKFVPVGDDQLQHLELTRTVARKFNSRFGDTFIEPKPLLTEAARVMSITDPGRKMSKSEPAGCIFLDDAPEAIEKKIRRAVTDSGATITYEPDERPEIANLLRIYAQFAGETPKDSAKRFKESNNAAFKADLADLLVASLKNFRESKRELLAHPKRFEEAFRKGSRDAHSIAQEKMLAVKKAIGLSL